MSTSTSQLQLSLSVAPITLLQTCYFLSIHISIVVELHVYAEDQCIFGQNKIMLPKGMQLPALVSFQIFSNIFNLDCCCLIFGKTSKLIRKKVLMPTFGGGKKYLIIYLLLFFQVLNCVQEEKYQTFVHCLISSMYMIN